MLFEKFDEDRSNTLELQEMHDMFKNSGFDVSKEHLEQLFQLVCTKKPYKMSLE